MLRNLLNDEAGFLVSAELVLLFTLIFCAVAVGATAVRDSLVQELGDVAEAIGALNQTYNIRGVQAPMEAANSWHAYGFGSGFNDEADDCDCKGIELTATTGKADPSTLDRPEGT